MRRATARRATPRRAPRRRMRASPYRSTPASVRRDFVAARRGERLRGIAARHPRGGVGPGFQQRDDIRALGRRQVEHREIRVALLRRRDAALVLAVERLDVVMRESGRGRGGGCIRRLRGRDRRRREAGGHRGAQRCRTVSAVFRSVKRHLAVDRKVRGSASPGPATPAERTSTSKVLPGRTESADALCFSAATSRCVAADRRMNCGR
ncbi:hypothetical protein BCO18430_01936 [Burkholderia contaminans]|nr:hypothetical protein BCO18430_01936 [Burkholderia contaminans]